MIALNTVLQNRYSITGKIGQGGMGTVYLATDLRFGSAVAVKESFYNDPNLRKAFEREASLLNRLRHPALPKVSDHFTEDDNQFLVMEYIAGEDLAELLEKQGSAFPVSQVFGWADQLLDALDFLHTQELPIIHRDIKPQNLKLTARGRIVLLDFGLAKGAPVHLACATVTGSVFGYSRNYAPLEQMQGAGTDPRSDIYSLGATLYHLLTNTTPPDALTRAAAVINGQPDPLRLADEVHAGVPKSLARALAIAMRQDAGGRWQTAAEMREALRAAHERLANGETDADDPRLFAPVFFEQETRRFDGLAGSRSPEATNNLLAQQTTPMGGVRRDGLLKSDVSDREAYITKLMTPAPVICEQPVSSKKKPVAIAASIVALLLVAVTAMNFSGSYVPNTQDGRTEAQRDNPAQASATQANVTQSDLAQAVAPSTNRFAQETDARESADASARAIASGRQARAGSTGVGANRPATRKPAPTERNQRQRQAVAAEVQEQEFPVGEFDFRRMQIDLSALDKAIAVAPTAAERVKMEALKKKWVNANKWRIQQRQEHNRVIAVPPRPPENLERPRRKLYEEPAHGNRNGASSSSQFQSAEPMIRASSSDSRRAQTRASSPVSSRTVCTG